MEVRKVSNSDLKVNGIMVSFDRTHTINLPLQLYLHLAPYPRYYQLFPET